MLYSPLTHKNLKEVIILGSGNSVQVGGIDPAYWTQLGQALDAAQRVKVAVFGVDGVTFNGLSQEGDPNKTRSRSFADGQGVSYIRDLGIQVVFLGNEKEPYAGPIGKLVEKWNDLPSAREGAKDQWKPIICTIRDQTGKTKAQVVQELLDERGWSWEDVACMSNDTVGIPLMQMAGLPTAPVNAEGHVKSCALWIAGRAGGNGAIRDLADFLIGARGIDIATLRYE